MTCSICKKEGCTGCNSSQAMDVYARVDTLLEMCEALLNGVEIDEGWKALLRGNVNGLRGVLKEYAQLVKSAEEMQVKLGKEHTALVAAEGRTIHGYGCMCGNCLAGRWVSTERQEFESWLYKRDRGIWMEWANRADSDSRAFLESVFPKLARVARPEGELSMQKKPTDQEAYQSIYDSGFKDALKVRNSAASHLRVALSQSLPTDDQIILGRIREALRILESK